MTAQEFAELIPESRPSGDGWLAHCPAHDDRTRSLKIDVGDDGTVLIKCFADCKVEAIVAALGLKMADLFPSSNTKSTGPRRGRHYPSPLAATPQRGPAGCTVAGYAAAKQLPVRTLIQLGLTNITYKGRPAMRIPYLAVDGTVAADRFRLALGKGGADDVPRFVWKKNSKPCLYGLDRLAFARSCGYIVLVEGESDTHTLVCASVPALGLPGAATFREEWAQFFADIPIIYVVIEPDKGGETVLGWLGETAIRDRVRLIRLVGFKDPSAMWIDDVVAFKDRWAEATRLAEPWAVYEERAAQELAAANALSHLTSPARSAHREDRVGSHPAVMANNRESQASIIVRLATEAGVDLWHTPAAEGYISVPVTSHHEHYALSSRAAREYLTRLFYMNTGKAPNATAIQNAVATLCGTARFDGEEHQVHLRVADDPAHGRIYLDLCDAEWQAVEITPTGWQVVANPPVRFRRPRGVLPLPAPQRGGSLQDLRRFLNVSSNEDFVLLVEWELAALRGRGPYPILVFIAEQGAAKTTTTRVLRRCCDPNESDVRRPPRNTEDLMIAGTNGHIVAFDNLSRLPDDLSDNLSVLATGGGFAVRQLYTNNEEHIFQAQRPIILNGISQVATRGDLLDRAIVITLPPIPDQRRTDEATFWRNFEAAQPLILGALLDAVTQGLLRLPNVQLDRKPRMADFAIWGVAVESGCPWPEGVFLRAYTGNRQTAVEMGLDGDPLADVIAALMKANATWRGTASDLLAELNNRTPEAVIKRKDWFSRAKQVADALRRLAPALRRTGVDVEMGNKHREARTGRRLITLRKDGARSSPSSPSSPDEENQPIGGDEPLALSPPSSPSSSPDDPRKYRSGDAGDDGDAEIPIDSGDAEGDDTWIVR